MNLSKKFAARLKTHLAVIDAKCMSRHAFTPLLAEAVAAAEAAGSRVIDDLDQDDVLKVFTAIIKKKAAVVTSAKTDITAGKS